MVRQFRYAPAAGRGNIVRGVLAALACAFLLVAAAPHPIVAVVLALMALVFAGFALRSLMKTRKYFELSEEALREVGAGNKQVCWNRIADVRLDFYTTRRDRDSGWMTLRIRDKSGSTVEVDSEVTGFEELVDMAETAANDAGVELSVATRVNMDAVAGRRL